MNENESRFVSTSDDSRRKENRFVCAFPSSTTTMTTATRKGSTNSNMGQCILETYSWSHRLYEKWENRYDCVAVFTFHTVKTSNASHVSIAGHHAPKQHTSRLVNVPEDFVLESLMKRQRFSFAWNSTQECECENVERCRFCLFSSIFLGFCLFGETFGIRHIQTHAYNCRAWQVATKAHTWNCFYDSRVNVNSALTTTTTKF